MATTFKKIQNISTTLRCQRYPLFERLLIHSLHNTRDHLFRSQGVSAEVQIGYKLPKVRVTSVGWVECKLLAMYCTISFSSMVSSSCQTLSFNHSGNCISQSMTLNRLITRCLSQYLSYYMRNKRSFALYRSWSSVLVFWSKCVLP